ncbi:putative transporter C22E12.01 [Golovinomyces cichoracearum]|uniref:Putative transporter C22E12.01 n=1 Tax=Golovinomyces cichoracearum TaxID=62708 RepID=A0A420H6P5_9PEZI|nr:putative transporter C22E12.01 [Golovinomyces cichoracearum]
MGSGNGCQTRRRGSLMSTIDLTNLPTHLKAKKKQKAHQMFGRGKNRSTVEEVALLGDRIRDEDVTHVNDDWLQENEEMGISEREWRRNKQSTRRNILLDEHRGVNIGPDIADTPNDHFFKEILVNGILIFLWYTFSLFLSIYNKWMFDPKRLNFHFPLFTTSFHMLVQFFLSFLVLFLIPRFRPLHDLKSISHSPSTQATNSVETIQENEGKTKSIMTLKFYLTHIAPCGIAMGLDIGLGNMSLKFISLTFYTMCKSSSLAFILFFAFLFRLEPPSIRLVLIIAVMTLGVLMMVAGEAKFSPIGFILVITAAFFSGFRWGLTQILLLRNPETSNPFSSIFFLAPVMFLGLFILAIPIEEISSLIAGLRILTETYGPITGPLLLLFPGTIAFCMTASEFALLKRTSVVTLSIAGIFKEIVTITSAGLVLKDKLTPINICGLVVTMIAIISYNLIKIQKIHQTSQEETHKKLSLNTGSTKIDYTTGAEDSDDP